MHQPFRKLRPMLRRQIDWDEVQDWPGSLQFRKTYTLENKSSGQRCAPPKCPDSTDTTCSMRCERCRCEHSSKSTSARAVVPGFVCRCSRPISPGPNLGA